MLLGGLWHGASWSFVAWGGYHGVLLVAQRFFERRPGAAGGREPSDEKAGGGWISRLSKIAFTFYLVSLGWVFFRAASLDAAWGILSALHVPAGLPAPSGEAIVVGALSALALALICAIDAVVIHRGERLERRSWLLWPLLALGQGFAMLLGESGHAFIYFQF
jgi:D-alanyl-lipoteichoic acid acyltransferase DltB (MBOAT superfamily)